jgi:hypothetical protein
MSRRFFARRASREGGLERCVVAASARSFDRLVGERSGELTRTALPVWPHTRDDRRMRVEGGAVVDEFELPGIGHVVARHTRTRTPDNGVTWACIFTVMTTGASDLAVVHRLSAPSLADGRQAVRHAVEFLAGRAVQSTAVTSSPGPQGPAAGAPRALMPITPRSPRRRATDVRRRDAEHERTPIPAGPLSADVPRIPVFDLPTGIDR